MKYFYAFLLACVSFIPGWAQQSYVHQVLFLNEGWYDFANDTLAIPPSVGSYDPVTQVYTVFDEIPEADFASAVIVDDVIYVAADNLILTYDKNTLTRLQMKAVPGVRDLAVWNDQLLVTRGDYLVFFDSYFQVYDKHSLELLYELPTTDGPAYASDAVVVRDDKAFIAINNGFVFGEEVGLIGIVDLVNRTYEEEIDLGPTGVNPDNIMMDDTHLYTLNNKNYTSSSITTFDPVSHTVETFDNIAANSGCGTSALAQGRIYYMEYGVDQLARFDVQTHQIIDTLAGTGAYYGLIDNKVDGQLIATWTDFFSQGTAYILNYEGTVLHAFDVGVSPGSIALDERMVTGVSVVDDAVSVECYPNPVSDQVTVRADVAIQSLSLYSPLGSLLFTDIPKSETTTLDLHAFPAGLYTIQCQLVTGNRLAAQILKQD